jgi:hypothetical protein
MLGRIEAAQQRLAGARERGELQPLEAGPYTLRLLERLAGADAVGFQRHLHLLERRLVDLGNAATPHDPRAFQALSSPVVLGVLSVLP